MTEIVLQVCLEAVAEIGGAENVPSYSTCR